MLRVRKTICPGWVHGIMDLRSAQFANNVATVRSFNILIHLLTAEYAETHPFNKSVTLLLSSRIIWPESTTPLPALIGHIISRSVP